MFDEVFDAYLTLMRLAMDSVNQYGRVNAARPGIDTTLQIMQVAKAQTLQECDDLQTSHPVMTNNDRGMRFVQILELRRDLPHRQMLTAIDASQVPLPRLANVEKQRALAGFGVERSPQFLNGHLTQRHLLLKIKARGLRRVN